MMGKHITMIEEEIFVDIKEFDGKYQISNLGNIRSLPRLKKHSEGNYFLTKERILKGGINGGGYRFIQCYHKGKIKNILIHQQVAIYFLGHKICGYEKVINHKDHNKLNNRYDNLEITTQRENSNKKHLKSSSKYTGVYWSKRHNKWVSRIIYKGKTYHLGAYEIEFDAHLCYEKVLNDILNNANPDVSNQNPRRKAKIN